MGSLSFMFFLLSISLLSFFFGILFGCNLVLRVLWFFLVLGSSPFILKQWNKKVFLDCLGCWKHTWKSLFNNGRNKDEYKWLHSVQHRVWGYTNAWWLRQRVENWFIKVKERISFKMFTLVSSNQVHQSCPQLISGPTGFVRERFKIIYGILRSILWISALRIGKSTWKIQIMRQHSGLPKTLWWCLFIRRTKECKD